MEKICFSGINVILPIAQMCIILNMQVAFNEVQLNAECNNMRYIFAGSVLWPLVSQNVDGIYIKASIAWL